MGRKAKRDPASRFHDPPHFSQSSDGVWPDLHRVDRQRPIKAVVIEWQALHGTVPQVDATVLDSGCVPSASLVNHLPRLINARYMPRCRELRQALNNHSGSETHFQHAVVWSDLKEVADPGAAISIHTRHDDATQPPQNALRAAKRVHQNVLHDITIDTAQSQLEEKQSRLEAVEGELESAKQAADQAQAAAAKLETTTAQLDELQTKLDQANSEIERLKSELQQTKAPQSQSGNAPPQP